jgi:hypothetical protein
MAEEHSKHLAMNKIHAMKPNENPNENPNKNPILAMNI